MMMHHGGYQNAVARYQLKKLTQCCCQRQQCHVTCVIDWICGPPPWSSWLVRGVLLAENWHRNYSQSSYSHSKYEHFFYLFRNRDRGDEPVPTSNRRVSMRTDKPFIQTTFYEVLVKNPLECLSLWETSQNSVSVINDGMQLWCWTVKCAMVVRGVNCDYNL